MSGRILTLQRQVRELGRLRAGLTETRMKDGREVTFPTSSRTWILTSANRTFLDAAAQLWGGDVAEWQPVGNDAKAWRVITDTPVIDAILPPGDPLSQYQELWTRGGCQRRCDGEQEMLSGSPCLCRAQFGDDFHEQKQGTVCDIHTRLNVFLPDLPDIGVWRVETKGFWPANHMAGYVDMIKGHVGPQALVPIRLRIEPRTKVKAGKTSQFIEIVIELRTSASFSQILEAPQILAIGGPADSRVIEQAPDRPAIESARAIKPHSPAEWRARFAQAQTLDELRSMWTGAGRDDALDDETRSAFKAEGDRIVGQPAAGAEPPTGGDEEPDAGTDLWAKAIDAATTVDELRQVWADMRASAVDDKALNQRWWARKSTITGEPLPSTAVAEQEPDRDLTWSAIMAAAGQHGWNTDDVMTRFAAHSGKEAADGTGWDYMAFLDAMRKGAIQ